jgi:nucleotide-binding universal stress UspA family protein
MTEDIPGRKKMEQLIEAVREPTVVHSPVLIDVSYISDKGMQAVVALAASLEWNVVHKYNKPVTLIARDGFKHVVPTDTSIRFNVFMNRVNATITHSVTAIPTPELMDRLIKQFKLGPSHARVFKAAVGEGVVDGVVDPDNPDEHLPEFLPEEEPHEMQSSMDGGNVAEELKAKAEKILEAKGFTPTERVEPTLNHMGDGAQYISPIMDTIIRQLIPEGADQITYRCKQCGLEFETKRSVGAHWQVHVKAGEVEATAGAKRTIVNVIPDYVPTEVHVSRGGATAQVRRLQAIIRDVQKAVGQDAIKEAERRAMVAERKVKEVEAERDAAVAKAERLSNDLRSLRELIGGLSDE